MTCDITPENLAAYADGDLPADRLDEIRRHLATCPACRQRLDALARADALLAAAGRAQPPTHALLAARHALTQATGRAPANEIMTLDDVADFLRLTPDQLGEIADQLPAFELAGQIRIRRERLLQWVEQRERSYTRQTAESWAAHAKVLSPETGAA